MIDIQFRECCERCPYIDVIWEQIRNVLEESTTVIGCKRACVCGAYHADNLEVPSQDVIVRGFQNADG